MSIEPTELESPKKKRSGLWSALAYFAGVALLVVGVYFVFPPSSTNETAAPEGPSVETTTTTVAQIQIDAPTYVAGEEPIADAAEVILPSVVNIQTSSGLGSGVIYDSDGLIVTAAHVVGEQKTVSIRFNDGRQVTGRVLGSVGDVDIAVIEVDVTDLPAATFSMSKPRVGQLAIAIGSPWGLDSTVTAGIISAVDQTNCGFAACFSMVQTDAAINPGNSGGALVDRRGEVVGINVSIFTGSGASDGVGFAVPASVAMQYAGFIVSGDPIETAFLGVTGDFVSEGRAGALITEVVADSAADDAGIAVGDVVIAVEGVPIKGIDDLQAQIRSHQPGETVDVILIRDTVEMTIEVTLGAQSPDLS